MRDLSDRLRDWDAAVRRLAEQAEARVADDDALVRDLHRAGRARPQVLLGPVLGVRPYDPGCGPDDSGQVTQAVLLVPEGLGVVFWDTEDLYALPPGPDRDREARRLFTPVAACRPLLRVQFLTVAADLVTRLVRRAGRRCPPRLGLSTPLASRASRGGWHFPRVTTGMTPRAGGRGAGPGGRGPESSPPYDRPTKSSWTGHIVARVIRPRPVSRPVRSPRRTCYHCYYTKFVIKSCYYT